MALERLISTWPTAANTMIRLMVGTIFVSEGIQKFIRPAERGPGRFMDIGLPAPELFAHSLGAVEIVCGALVLIGLLTRLAAGVLVIDMVSALLITKLPILFEEGFWVMAHEARVDYAMLLAGIFLLIGGAGKWAADYRLQHGIAGSSTTG